MTIHPLPAALTALAEAATILAAAKEEECEWREEAWFMLCEPTMRLEDGSMREDESLAELANAEKNLASAMAAFKIASDLVSSLLA